MGANRTFVIALMLFVPIAGCLGGGDALENVALAADSLRSSNADNLSAEPILGDAEDWTCGGTSGQNSIAWGDMDGDGNMDLALGTNSYNHVYLSRDGALADIAAWTSNNSLFTQSIAA